MGASTQLSGTKPAGLWAAVGLGSASESPWAWRWGQDSLEGYTGSRRSLVFEPVGSWGACPTPRHSPDGRESCTAQGSGRLSPGRSPGSRAQR